MDSNALKSYQTVLFHSEESLTQLIQTIVEQKLSENKLQTTTPSITPNQIFTHTEAADFLNIHPQSLIRARNSGRIRGKKINGRNYGYEYQELQNYRLKKRKQPN